MQIQWYSSKEIRALYGLSSCSLSILVKRGKIQRQKQGRGYVYRDPELFAAISRKPKPDSLPVLRGCEVAKILKISYKRVQELVQAGKINCLQVGRNRKYSVDDVQRYITYRDARRKMTPGDPRPIPGERSRREVLVSYLEKQLHQNA